MRNPLKWQKPADQKYAETLEQIEQAEAWGIDHVWLSEHHFFEDGYLPQTLTMAAAIAARTKKIRIGTAVILAPLRPAIQVAEEAALVDILSSGRLELGLGAGYHIPEFEAYDADIKKRYTLTDLRTQEIRTLLHEKVTPKPIQKSVPMWLGYMGPQGAKRAGKLGCNLLHIGNLEQYLEGLKEGNHDPAQAKMSGLLLILVANDPERTFEIVAPHAAYQINSYTEAILSGRKGSPRLITGDDLIKQGRKVAEPNLSVDFARLQVLTPDEYVEYVKTVTKDLPVAEVHSWANIAGMPNELAYEHIELMATKVKPQLQ